MRVVLVQVQNMGILVNTGDTSVITALTTALEEIMKFTIGIRRTEEKKGFPIMSIYCSLLL